MRVKDKINLDMAGLIEHGPINIVAFGDSVTHGAFHGYFDYESVYHNKLRQKMIHKIPFKYFQKRSCLKLAFETAP